MSSNQNVKRSQLMIPRDVSWMYFNYRILQEAQNKSVPLLERLGFMGIYSNNLDEFFRVRMATLARLAESKLKQTKNQSEEARKAMKAINKLNSQYNKEFEFVMDSLTEELKKEKLCIVDDTCLDEKQKQFIHQYYRNQLAGFTNPVWLTQVGLLANETDDSIYLAIKMSKWHDGYKKEKKDYALLRVPVEKFGRFLRLPDEDGCHYIMYMDDVIRFCLPMIFASVAFNLFEAY